MDLQRHRLFSPSAKHPSLAIVHDPRRNSIFPWRSGGVLSRLQSSRHEVMHTMAANDPGKEKHAVSHVAALPAYLLRDAPVVWATEWKHVL
jgi:hypothetical protein